MKPKYFLMAVPAMILAACSNEEPSSGAVADGTAVVTADIAGIAGSRAHDNVWDAGDRIGISGSTGTVSYVNVPYSTTGDGSFAASNGVDNGIFFQNKETATFSAYYPYNAHVSAQNAIISANTADQSKSKEFDFLFASGATGNVDNPAISFTGDAAFTHRMTQLVIKVIPDNNAGFDASAALSGGTSSVSGLKSEGSFDTATGLAAATGDAADWTLNGNVTPSTEGTTLTFAMILFPQTVSDGITYSIDYEGATYSCKLTPALAPGKRYTYNVTLRKTGLTVASATITDWENQPEQDIPADMEEMPVVDVTEITEPITITKNSILSGKTEYPITIKAGLDIILHDISIKDGNSGIICQGDANVYIQGNNRCSIAAGAPGSTLTIDEIDGGALYIGPYTSQASIGAGKDGPCGDIVINGGYFEIMPNNNCAHIGSSKYECGNITINGGTFEFPRPFSSNRPFIGNTLWASCGDITINGGNFTAEQTFMYSSGAIIGADFNSTLVGKTTTGRILITGGTFDMKSHGSPFIGGGDGGGCADIFIEGGTFKFTQVYEPATNVYISIGVYKKIYSGDFTISVTGGEFNFNCEDMRGTKKIYWFSQMPEPYAPAYAAGDYISEFPNENGY